MLNQIGLTNQLSIADILDRFGIPHRRNRCACPIHGGDNPTAFSFTDQVFYCHTRGCSGNTITLLKHLLNTDFRGVLGYLGSNFQSTRSVPRSTSVRQPPRIGRTPKWEPIELSCLKSRFREV